MSEQRYYFVRGFEGKSQILFGDYPQGFQSISSGTSDLEESKTHWKLHDKPCVECGQMFTTNYCEPYQAILKRDCVCFGCNHWRDMLKHIGNPNQAIVSGRHYLICPDLGGPDAYKGHGGSRFKIQFNDGRVEVSTNLWSQGEIPPHFSERLRNNATFVYD